MIMNHIYIMRHPIMPRSTSLLFFAFKYKTEGNGNASSGDSGGSNSDNPDGVDNGETPDPNPTV